MNLRRLRAPLLSLIAVAVAIPFARRADEVRYDPEPGVRTELPARVDGWQGEQIRYCTSESCQKMWRTSEIVAAGHCPSCQARLDEMALAERSLLPGDTTLSRFEYRKATGRKIYVTIVLSGRERSSIHRPETCLSSYGSEIVGSETLAVPLESASPLGLRMLTLRQTYEGRTGYSYYAYWFVAKGRQTPSHVRRMLAMASDRLFRGVTHRWAYISVTGSFASGTTAHREEVRDFVRALHPLLVAP